MSSFTEGDTQAKDINILAWDLSFYDTQAPSTIGLLDEFICSEVDNLLSVFWRCVHFFKRTVALTSGSY